MSLDLALRAQLQLGGFICVAGFCVQSEAYPKAFGPFAKKQKILITHGTRDETILLEDAEKSYDVLRKEGVPFELKVYDKPHSFQLKEEVPFLEETLKSWIRTK
ncbi:MAG: hypothetical protein JWQ35_1967 [Bacteriovoracaceae bacterium]|nr:hypothetical protein [Bacteriovoracaceae bacterium]